MTEYQFQCRIIDKATGETVIADYTYLTAVDQFGGCESVDMTVARMLRQFAATQRKEREKTA